MNDGDKVSIAAQLEKLEAMRANGTLTEAGFQKLKAGLIESSGPKTSRVAAWLIGALAAVAVVVVVFLVAMPRHAADKVTSPVASAPPAMSQPAPPQPATPPPSNAPLDRAANDTAPAQVAAEPPPTFQTSFDCAQARGFALRMICTNPNLAAQDVQLAAMYRRARANAVDPSQLSDQQQEWLAARDSCASIGCLANVYAARRRELAQWITN